MKIKVLLFALAILQTNLILAQTKKLQIGLEGGPTLSSIDGKERFKNNHSTKVGYVAGLSFQYDISKIFSLRTGIGFERKGNKGRLYSFSSDSNGNMVLIDEGSFRINFDYLTFPLLARISLGKKKRYFVNAGPYFAHLLNISDSKKLYKNAPFSWKNYYKRFDCGITAGVGGAIPLKDYLLLTLEVRYNFGLRSYIRETNYYQLKIYNNSANLLVGIAYKF